MRQGIGRLSGGPVDLAISMPNVPALRPIRMVESDHEVTRGARRQPGAVLQGIDGAQVRRAMRL